MKLRIHPFLVVVPFLILGETYGYLDEQFFISNTQIH